FRAAQAVKPTRRLITPYKRMRFDRNIICARIVIDAIKWCPVIHIAGAFNRTPFAFVFRRDLIPVASEVRAHVAGGGDVTHKELVSAATLLYFTADREIICVKTYSFIFGFDDEMLERCTGLRVVTLQQGPPVS